MKIKPQFIFPDKKSKKIKVSSGLLIVVDLILMKPLVCQFLNCHTIFLVNILQECIN